MKTARKSATNCPDTQLHLGLHEFWKKAGVTDYCEAASLSHDSPQILEAAEEGLFAIRNAISVLSTCPSWGAHDQNRIDLVTTLMEQETNIVSVTRKFTEGK